MPGAMGWPAPGWPMPGWYPGIADIMSVDCCGIGYPRTPAAGDESAGCEESMEMVGSPSRGRIEIRCGPNWCQRARLRCWGDWAGVGGSSRKVGRDEHDTTFVRGRGFCSVLQELLYPCRSTQ
jgi:hypothetical protein